MIIQTIVAFFATVSFAIIFNVPPKEYIPCGITGAAGWLCYLVVYAVHPSAVMASFIATMVLTWMSMFLAVRRSKPVSVFLICGIFPLVPGAGIYYTAYYLIMGDNSLTLQKGVETMKIAAAIALGIMLSTLIPYGFFRKLSNILPHLPKKHKT